MGYLVAAEREEALVELGAGEGWELGAVGVDVGVDLGLGGRAAVGEGLEPGAANDEGGVWSGSRAWPESGSG